MANQLKINKQGFHNRYALACGYVDLAERDQIRLTLEWHHNHYRVICHDHENGVRLYGEAVPTIAGARQAFNKQKRKYKLVMDKPI